MGDPDRTVRTSRPTRSPVYLRGHADRLPANGGHRRGGRRGSARERSTSRVPGPPSTATRSAAAPARFPSTAAPARARHVPVSCLTSVTVLPTHTRRGHLTRLMRAQLDAAVEAGEVASLLVAAEWPIYGRFGYGPLQRVGRVGGRRRRGAPVLGEPAVRASSSTPPSSRPRSPSRARPPAGRHAWAASSGPTGIRRDAVRRRPPARRRARKTGSGSCTATPTASPTASSSTTPRTRWDGMRPGGDASGRGPLLRRRRSPSGSCGATSSTSTSSATVKWGGDSGLGAALVPRQRAGRRAVGRVGPHLGPHPRRRRPRSTARSYTRPTASWSRSLDPFLAEAGGSPSTCRRPAPPASRPPRRPPSRRRSTPSAPPGSAAPTCATLRGRAAPSTSTPPAPSIAWRGPPLAPDTP